MSEKCHVLVPVLKRHWLLCGEWVGAGRNGRGEIRGEVPVGVASSRADGEKLLRGWKEHLVRHEEGVSRGSLPAGMLANGEKAGVSGIVTGSGDSLLACAGAGSSQSTRASSTHLFPI